MVSSGTKCNAEQPFWPPSQTPRPLHLRCLTLFPWIFSIYLSKLATAAHTAAFMAGIILASFYSWLTRPDSPVAPQNMGGADGTSNGGFEA